VSIDAAVFPAVPPVAGVDPAVAIPPPSSQVAGGNSGSTSLTAMPESLAQLDELLVTLGASDGPS